MFDKLADLIGRRHKLIILAWVLALIPCLLLAPNINSVLQYEETGSAGSDLESVIADGYIREQFGDASEMPSTLIVVRSDDVLENTTRKAMLQIVRDIEDASPYTVPAVEVLSVYDIVDSYTVNIVLAANGLYYGLNSTAWLVLGLPAEFQELWFRTDQAATLVFGIPVGHFQAWVETSEAMPEADGEAVDAAANSTYLSVLQDRAASLPAEQGALMLGWYHAYIAQ